MPAITEYPPILGSGLDLDEPFTPHPAVLAALPPSCADCGYHDTTVDASGRCDRCRAPRKPCAFHPRRLLRQGEGCNDCFLEAEAALAEPGWDEEGA